MSRQKVDIFSLEWEGLDEFNELLGKMEKEHEAIIVKELTDFGQDVETGTKALVHHDEGNLEDSINFGKARKRGSTYEVTGGSNLKYALRRHEQPYSKRVYDKIPGDKFYQYGRGWGTRNKPNWRGYAPGRKFMENAINALEKDYNAMNTRVLEKIMGLK